MRRSYTILFSILLSTLLFTSCQRKDTVTEITILQINDVYEIAPLNGGKSGGMARVQTVHKELLRDNPNTFLLHAGDFLNPSLLGTMKYKGEKIRGKQMVECMNAMDFDLVTFGNHEFDLSEKDLQKRLNESQFDWVSANVKHKMDSITGPFYKQHEWIKSFIPKTYILTARAGKDAKPVKIGVVSVTIPVNKPGYVEYDDIYQAAEKAYNTLKPKTDFIIALTHLTKEQDKELLKHLPDIKLVIGGHEHVNMLIPVGDSFIAKADANAATVYIHHIKYHSATGKVELKSELKTIDDHIKSDPEVDQIVQKWQVVLNDKIKSVISSPDEVIYHAQTPLDAREKSIRYRQTNFGQVVARAMKRSTHADAAVVNSGSVRIDDRLTGDLTAVDIFRALPYGGAVFSIDIKGDFLKKILDFGESAKGEGAYLQRDGITRENGKWIINGKPVNNTQTYRIAITDFLLTGYDIPFLTYDNKQVLKVHEPRPDAEAFDIRKAVINELKSMKGN